MTFAYAALAVSLVMWLLWARQCQTRNATSVDAAWALLIGACALWFAVSGTGDPGRRALLGTLGALWGLRLGWHLIRDRVLGRAHAGEDGRYAAMRDHWGTRWALNFAWFYQAQAVMVLLFAAPFWWLAQDARPLGTLADIVGVAWWAVTLGMVWLADHQLARWRADPATRGRTCRAGLWSWSRHPNYLGEWLHWLAWPLIAWGTPAMGGFFALAALLYVLLRFVTGIPWTERRALATRPDYAAYQREVPMFFPWGRTSAPRT